MTHTVLKQKQIEELLKILKSRFENNMNRHKALKWENVEAKLIDNPEILWSLSEMERTKGEPDVTGFDKRSGEYIFTDCSAESPYGRRNICYDREGQKVRDEKGIHPAGNAVDMAKDMGIILLGEKDYRELQTLGNFDTKTSSWVETPSDIRKAGGALFADKRFGHVFIYHNGAPSFYSARGFRGMLKV